MTRIDLFLILIIVLVVLLFVLVILLITFREALEEQCCRSWNSNANESTQGVGNPAFNDQEHSSAATPRPFSSMDATECPPSYEEAVKQELFRFRLPPSQPPRSRSSSLNDISESDSGPSTSFSSEDSSSSSEDSSSSSRSPDLPSTSRGRSATVTATLSTIEEEESEETVTVVIDCIGVQAARLMEKCDTRVALDGGQELASHSKC